jgi:hypothetical protein
VDAESLWRFAEIERKKSLPVDNRVAAALARISGAHSEIVRTRAFALTFAGQGERFD